MFKVNDAPIWRTQTNNTSNMIKPRQPQPGWGYVQTMATPTGRVITERVK